jgi:hypothetical protein
LLEPTGVRLTRMLLSFQMLPEHPG